MTDFLMVLTIFIYVKFNPVRSLKSKEEDYLHPILFSLSP